MGVSGHFTLVQGVRDLRTSWGVVCEVWSLSMGTVSKQSSSDSESKSGSGKAQIFGSAAKTDAFVGVVVNGVSSGKIWVLDGFPRLNGLLDGS